MHFYSGTKYFRNYRIIKFWLKFSESLKSINLKLSNLRIFSRIWKKLTQIKFLLSINFV